MRAPRVLIRNHPDSVTTILALPVKWLGGPRVILVAKPGAQREVLARQLASANPVRIDSASSI